MGTIIREGGACNNASSDRADGSMDFDSITTQRDMVTVVRRPLVRQMLRTVQQLVYRYQKTLTQPRTSGQRRTKTVAASTRHWECLVNPTGIQHNVLCQAAEASVAKKTETRLPPDPVRWE